MNVTLHIGTQKTASTAIQNLFTLNEEKFRDQGIYYPIPPHSRGEKTTDVINHSFIFEKMRYFEDIIPKSEESFEKFFRDFCCSSKKEALKENIKQIFISSEMFWLFNETQLQKIKKILLEFFDDIKILIFIRRQDHFIESLWNQDTKTGLNTMPIAEYVDLALREGFNIRGRMCCLDYFKKISEISKIFHHKNVITFLYFKGNHSPLRDILRFFQIRGHLLLRTEPHAGATEGVSNHSLPVEYVEAMRLFFGKIIDEKERTKLCEKARKSDTFNKCDFIDRKDYTLLDSISRKKILSRFSSGNKLLIEHFVDLGQKKFLDFLDKESSPPFTGFSHEKWQKYVVFFSNLNSEQLPSRALD